MTLIVVDSFSEVINESSSKGNQLKFYKNGVWAKIDNMHCYEGLAEEFISLVEECIYDFSFVKYKSEQISYNEDIYTGCYSYNMYNNPDIEFISCRKIFKQSNVPLSIFIKGESTANNIKNVVEKLYELTGVNTLNYFRQLLMLDCLILNEDRHYMNIGVCFNRLNKVWGTAQCFDNGSSLFCTNWTYRKSKSLDDNIKAAMTVARPFSKFYDKQLNALLQLGCKPLCINKSKLEFLLGNYSNKVYPDELIIRMKSVLINRLNYYNGRAFIFM